MSQNLNKDKLAAKHSKLQAFSYFPYLVVEFVGDVFVFGCVRKPVPDVVVVSMCLVIVASLF